MKFHLVLAKALAMIAVSSASFSAFGGQYGCNCTLQYVCDLSWEGKIIHKAPKQGFSRMGRGVDGSEKAAVEIAYRDACNQVANMSEWLKCEKKSTGWTKGVFTKTGCKCLEVKQNPSYKTYAGPLPSCSV